MREGFFDSYPRFYETGNARRDQGQAIEHGPSWTRLNARYDILIDRHRDLIEGKTILDVGSHDGRWAFAAIEAGARHVIGIEPNAEVVADARRNFEAYGIDEGRYTFHTLDARKCLNEQDIKVDTVFLFGILYHVHYHVDLIQAVAATGAAEVIVDTNVCPDGERERHLNTMSFRIEKADQISTGKLEAVQGRVIVGMPSRHVLRLLFGTFGYNTREIPWDRYLTKWGQVGLKDYAEGDRATFLARTKPAQEQAPAEAAAAAVPAESSLDEE